jgi:hypothetical protein
MLGCDVDCILHHVVCPAVERPGSLELSFCIKKSISSTLRNIH